MTAPSFNYPASTWLKQLCRRYRTALWQTDLSFIKCFERDLQQAYQEVAPNFQPDGRAHYRIKQKLASRYGAIDVDRKCGGKGAGLSLQSAVQFVCGYHDLDLRDAAGVGHGRIVILAENAPRSMINRIVGGDLVGLLATEAAGGTAIRGMKTMLVPHRNGWVLRGEKLHVSRILEADVFVVIARSSPLSDSISTNDDGLTAVLVDPAASGVACDAMVPTGLRGWSWGRVTFDDVQVSDADILGRPSDGHSLFARHFTTYRLLVAATALGAAARVWDEAAARLLQRAEETRRFEPRDFVLASLANWRCVVERGLLASINAKLSNDSNAAGMELKGTLCKLALEGATELSRILGAAGMVLGSPIEKILRDLQAYQFADGLSWELLRAAGKAELASFVSSKTQYAS